MATTKWNQLSPRARRLLMVGGAVDGALKLAALVDLARRPAHQVRGSKKAWAAAIIVTNSMGVVPMAYFTHGRRTPVTLI